MLDLDQLARQRAHVLNEPEEKWRNTLWSPTFQALSARMSDGEVEDFLGSCPSLRQLEAAIQFVNAHPHSLVASPYTLLVQEAQKAGLGLGDWMKTLSSHANSET